LDDECNLSDDKNIKKVIEKHFFKDWKMKKFFFMSSFYLNFIIIKFKENRIKFFI
jgi:hypothetical protein